MSLDSNVKARLREIAVAEKNYAREPQSVHVLAVSKKQTADAIRAVYQSGIHDFGESYWQEAKEKQVLLQDLAITWHFIGPLQSNKAKPIATHFDWVHSVSRNEIADKLNAARAGTQQALNVCIQVNLDDEASKSGCALDEVLPLARHILNCPNLKLRGLMAIPKKQTDDETSYHSFFKLTQALTELNQTLNLSLDTLSMGMSDDFIPAIRAGSTWVRIGRGIFMLNKK